MSNSRRPYRKFTKEFKLEAIRLSESGIKPVTQIARELDVRVNQIYKWKKQLMEKEGKAFSRTKTKDSSRKPTDLKSELERLQKENERLQGENDILKKAAAYFARELK